MSGWEYIAVFLAGVGAGTINTVVGSGTLITFPTLLAVGLPPVTANVTNTVGLWPGSVSGAWGYRRELRGQGRRLLRLGTATVTGAVIGAVALLTLPGSVFGAIVPVLVGLGCVLVLLQPWISARVRRRTEHRQHTGWGLWSLVLGTGVYGGYFGAAQGVLLMAILGIGLDEDLQRLNAAKNVLAALANIVAAVVFVAVAEVSWVDAGLVAAGSILGGQLGALVGRRLPPWLLRGVIVAVGLVAITQLV